jgi:predicted Rossmann-fold nucleotide-binding protein
MLCVVQEELAQGFDFIKSHPKMITILGSARVPEGDFYYEKARELAYRFAQRRDWMNTTSTFFIVLVFGLRNEI